MRVATIALVLDFNFPLEVKVVVIVLQVQVDELSEVGGVKIKAEIISCCSQTYVMFPYCGNNRSRFSKNGQNPL
jgi:hypothetical protein